MGGCEPRVRRRGFFFHSDTTGEPDTAEHENPEGFVVRFRLSHQPHPRRSSTTSRGTSHSRMLGGRAGAEMADDSLPQIRSGNVTGSRQRSHSLR